MKPIIEKIDKDIKYIVGQINPAANNPNWNVMMSELALNLSKISQYLQSKLPAPRTRRKNDTKG